MAKQPWESADAATPTQVHQWSQLDPKTRNQLIKLGWRPKEWDTTKEITRCGVLKRIIAEVVEDSVRAGDARFFNFREG